MPSPTAPTFSALRPAASTATSTPNTKIAARIRQPSPNPRRFARSLNRFTPPFPNAQHPALPGCFYRTAHRQGGGGTRQANAHGSNIADDSQRMFRAHNPACDISLPNIAWIA
jgi:hypothetical protein